MCIDEVKVEWTGGQERQEVYGLLVKQHNGQAVVSQQVVPLVQAGGPPGVHTWASKGPFQFHQP